MHWIHQLRQHLHVTALEARALLIIAVTFSAGTLIYALVREPSLHEHATAGRIGRILDSLQNQTFSQPVVPDSQALKNTHTHVARPQPFAEPQRVVNLNSASVHELDALPGIGPATASLIIDARLRNRFTSVDDLLDVKGIGEKKLERIRPYVTAP